MQKVNYALLPSRLISARIGTSNTALPYLIDHTTDALLSVADGLAATFGLFDRLHHLLFLLSQILPLSGTSRLFTNLDGRDCTLLVLELKDRSRTSGGSLLLF
jgi:hypothetical protein